MKTIIDDPFWTNPEFTMSLNRCGVEISLSLKIEEANYPMISRLHQGNAELLYDAYSEAVEKQAPQIALKVLQAHEEFYLSLQAAENDATKRLET